MVVLLSQPLYYSPEEYLLVLNPFCTYFTSNRCKNVKNLFISLINTVLSYDCSGYVSTLFDDTSGHSLSKCNWLIWRFWTTDDSFPSCPPHFGWVQATFYWQPLILDPRPAQITPLNSRIFPYAEGHWRDDTTRPDYKRTLQTTKSCAWTHQLRSFIHRSELVFLEHHRFGDNIFTKFCQ